MNFFKQRLRKAEQAVKDLDFALKQLAVPQAMMISTQTASGQVKVGRAACLFIAS